MAMLAEEGEFPLGLGPVRRSGGIAKVAQRPDLLGDATGIVTEDLENGGDKLVHGSGGISQRGRSKTLPPVAFDLF